jgi:hypothetical protein
MPGFLSFILLGDSSLASGLLILKNMRGTHTLKSNLPDLTAGEELETGQEVCLLLCSALPVVG